MKKVKQLFAVIALAFAFAFVLADTQDVQAAASKRAEGVVYINPTYNGERVWKSINKMRMMDGEESSFYVYFGRAGDYISDVKVNKKGLIAGVTYQYSGSWSENDYNCYGTIGLIAQKTGTYKVSFKVRKADGSVAGSYTMRVYCTSNDYIYKTIKLGSNTVYSAVVTKKGTTYTTKTTQDFKVANGLTSAKLSITPNAGYKITGIVVVYRDAKGVAKTQKVKNNRTIKLSQQYASRYYYSDGTTSTSAKMVTAVYVSYKDRYLGTSRTYSVVKKSGVKMIKCVEKKIDGTKRTTFTQVTSAGGNLSFWHY